MQPPEEQLRRTVVHLAVRARIGLLVVALAFAPLTVVPPVSGRLLAAVLALITAWTATYAYVASHSGLVWWLIATDIALTTSICLLIGRLVPLRQVSAGSSWAVVFVTTCVLSTGFAWPYWASVPGGLAVTARYVLGQRIAGTSATASGAIVAGQVLAIAAVMALVRHARAAADEAFDGAQAAAWVAAWVAAFEHARRADERRQLSLLHDTALATLTMIAAPDVTIAPTTLRRSARADVAMLETLASPPSTVAAAPLDGWLSHLTEDMRPMLHVTMRTVPCQVPAPVGEAFRSAAREALVNTFRYAQVTEATVILSMDAERVVVEIVDHGVGFAPDRVAAYRYGMRNSIAARMASVGGTARLTSAVGAGTRWRLEWIRD